MQFTQIEFLLFLCLLVALVWRCTTRNQRNLVLLGASYYFYSYWDIRFCGLLAFSTIADYWLSHRMAVLQSQTARRSWLWVSVCVNLGVLGFFKYCNFFIESASSLLESLGWNPHTLNIILPVGISFYTFQTLSYSIDVYRRRIEPANSVLDFALYVAFFPQLVAGPIVRASELLPQLAIVPQWSGRRFYGGFQTMLRGLVKKVLLADRMGEVVDVVFEAPDLYSSSTIWLAVLCYTGQIYYDFSGYSDIAIGVAKMLGYRFPINFRHPYLSTSMAQFWSRWHMTLSRWLRDYLYIPLGGNRRGTFRTKMNLLITMLLGGLWHGAAWTFVFWGLWHGVALAGGRSRMMPRTILSSPKIQWGITMVVVIFGWVLFRSGSLVESIEVYQRLVIPSAGIRWFPPLAILAFSAMIIEHCAWTTRMRRAMRLPIDCWYSPVATSMMIWALVLYAPREFTPFVYFQF